MIFFFFCNSHLQKPFFNISGKTKEGFHFHASVLLFLRHLSSHLPLIIPSPPYQSPLPAPPQKIPCPITPWRSLRAPQREEAFVQGWGSQEGLERVPGRWVLGQIQEPSCPKRETQKGIHQSATFFLGFWRMGLAWVCLDGNAFTWARSV